VRENARANIIKVLKLMLEAIIC